MLNFIFLNYFFLQFYFLKIFIWGGRQCNHNLKCHVKFHFFKLFLFGIFFLFNHFRLFVQSLVAFLRPQYFSHVWKCQRKYLFQPFIEGVYFVYPYFDENDCKALYESIPIMIAIVLKCRVIGPITKDFVINLNKVEYLYIVFHLTLLHIFLLYCNVWLCMYNCTNCIVLCPIFKS